MDHQRINQLNRQNRRLEEQNSILKQSLEELIAVNTELTQSIQSYSKNNDNEQSRLKQLEEENQNLRNQLMVLSQKVKEELSNGINNSEVEELREQNAEMSSFIKQLVESAKITKQEYDKQIQMLRGELQHSKNMWENKIRQIDNRYLQRIRQYEADISTLKAKTEVTNRRFQNQMLKQSKQLKSDQMNLKVSTTIEDVRNIYEKQLNQKQKAINVYVRLLKQLKERIKAG